MNPIIVTYYTDAKYRHLAARLAKSCDRRRIPCETEKIADLGSWQKNTHQKPKFILRMLNTYKNCEWVMWVDADAVVRGKLALVEGDFDVAAYRFRPASLFHGEDWHNLGQLFNGTLLFRNTKFSREVLEEWGRENKAFPDRLDQKNLASVLSRSNPSRLRCLRPEYCWIERLMRSSSRDISPIIVHEARAMDGLRNVKGRWNSKLSSPPVLGAQKCGGGHPDGVRWSGHLFDLSGYAKANREILFRAANTLRISIERPPHEEPVTVDDYTRLRLEAMSQVKVSPNSTFVRFYVPVKESAGSRRRVIYTMMETADRVHKDMVATINRHYTELWTPTRWNSQTFYDSGVRIPTRIMPLGVNPNIYYPGKASAPLMAKLMTTPRAGRVEEVRGTKFVTVGQPTFRKGLQYLVKAFSDLGRPDTALILATTAHEDLFGRSNPFSLIGDPMELKVKIYHLSGRMSEFGMADLYRSCNAYVSTSLGEGFNLPLFEASACGLLVIAPDHTAHSEFLSDRDALLFPAEGSARYPEGDAVCDWYRGMKFAKFGADSMNALVAHMADVVDNPVSAVVMASGLSSRIRRDYTWDQAASRVVSSLMNGKDS